ncbi:PDZ domain-containing protein 11 [Procambarus clarkii]|uniref:PDZ domain-containing protein 11 n=1 Tax=Procambarus clarkii TaxID=6728 RepID=UPI001E671B22|nr:PDZ domain-containing protein 11-like [Procambarus clarkii]XP_045611456.1 PDZ domain-containing protein 11-like [Procambarus clarkii]XP_045611457.1 PDZ domain-containing protein 11-like [Procambarus clarkii]
MDPSSMVELPAYEYAPRWMQLDERCHHPDYNNDLTQFLTRTVTLIREKVSDALGFNIRGGKEHFCGIYLSKVMPNTEAERLGLREGDQIVSVNGTDFEDIEHAKAVKILKSNTEIMMQLRNFPYGYKKTYENVQNSNIASS